MKEKCKDAIALAFWTANCMPLLFSKEELLNEICENYGTEFVAECMLEMGVE